MSRLSWKHVTAFDENVYLNQVSFKLLWSYNTETQCIITNPFSWDSY